MVTFHPSFWQIGIFLIDDLGQFGNPIGEIVFIRQRRHKKHEDFIVAISPLGKRSHMRGNIGPGIMGKIFDTDAIEKVFNGFDVIMILNPGMAVHYDLLVRKSVPDPLQLIPGQHRIPSRAVEHKYIGHGQAEAFNKGDIGLGAVPVNPIIWQFGNCAALFKVIENGFLLTSC